MARKHVRLRVHVQGTAWKGQATADLTYLVGGLSELPMPDSQREQVLERLRNLLETRFAADKEAKPAPAAPVSSSPASQKAKLPSVAASRYAPCQEMWRKIGQATDVSKQLSLRA